MSEERYKYYKFEFTSESIPDRYFRIGQGHSAYQILNNKLKWEHNGVVMDQYEREGYWDYTEVIDPALIKILESYEAVDRWHHR